VPVAFALPAGGGVGVGAGGGAGVDILGDGLRRGAGGFALQAEMGEAPLPVLWAVERVQQKQTEENERLSVRDCVLGVLVEAKGGTHLLHPRSDVGREPLGQVLWALLQLLESRHRRLKDTEELEHDVSADKIVLERLLHVAMQQSRMSSSSRVWLLGCRRASPRLSLPPSTSARAWRSVPV
jgi:hypothetical protein